jgi:uncharacterized protein with HEPN domain
LFDVITAWREAERFIADGTLNNYLGSQMLRAAVERKFEIICEALVRLRTKDQETFLRISASQQAIAPNDLPTLRVEAEQLLNEDG